MRKKMNNKGFTLIELLAVIIVLAIIMVLAIPSVLNASNSAKKKSFVIYAQRVAEKAAEYVSYNQLNGTSSSLGKTFSAADIGLTDTGTYKVCVKYDSSASSDTDMLKIYITDEDNYYFDGKSMNELNDGNLGTDGKKTLTKTDDTCKLS